MYKCRVRFGGENGSPAIRLQRRADGGERQNALLFHEACKRYVSERTSFDDAPDASAASD